MAYTYEQLSKMVVADLRKIADGIQHEATSGHSTMHKDKLLPAICLALGIETHAHHDVVGINKKKVKAEIRSLKAKREGVLKEHNKKELKEIRKQIHKLKHKLRKSIV